MFNLNIDLSLFQDFIDRKVPLGIAFYTDGGSKENRPTGVSGWGIHAFIYAAEQSKQSMIIKTYVATDCGYIVGDRLSHSYEVYSPFNESLGKYPVNPIIVTPVVNIDICGALIGTNNVAELTAVKNAVLVLNEVMTKLPITQAHLRSDSKITMDGVLTRKEMIKRGWCRKDRQPIANIELWKETVQALDDLEELNLEKVEFEWVRGHQDFWGNIQADALAGKGIVLGNNNQFTPLVIVKKSNITKKEEGLDLSKIEVNYLMADSKWYLHALHPVATEHGYELYVGSHKEDKRKGQKQSEFFDGVVRINELSPGLVFLNDLICKLDSVDRGMEIPGLYYANTGNLTKAETSEALAEKTGSLLNYDYHRRAIETYKGVELVNRLLNDGQSQKQRNLWVEMSNMLTLCCNETLPLGWYMNDVTDKFYTIGKTKKDLPDYKFLLSSDPAITLDVLVNLPTKESLTNNVITTCPAKATVTFGITAPNRRTFNGIKAFEPKIYVLTIYRPEASFTYYTVIKLNNGEMGIWSNMAANEVNLYNRIG